MDNRKLKKRLCDSIKRLSKMLDMDAPDVVLANEVVALWSIATADFGPKLYEALGRQAQRDARQRHGLCQDCDSDIATQLTHPPYCEQCEARISREVDEVQAEMDRNFPIDPETGYRQE